jgi:hypothetical protein
MQQLVRFLSTGRTSHLQFIPFGHRRLGSAPATDFRSRTKFAEMSTTA